MAKVLLTAGPIPTRLDSVKFLTNRFKGGLALKTAKWLSDQGHDVTIAAWEHADFLTNLELPVVLVQDVQDYFNKVLDFEADAYILAAAVANLGPTSPYEGKFPSHNYKVGEKFNIEFTIMPRVIDEIKKKYPTSTLIGYKLFDGDDEELIAAARHTLDDSRANLVFANHPAWAKERKIAITADGGAMHVTFAQHLELIDQLLNEKWYRTSHLPTTFTRMDYAGDEESVLEYLLSNYPRHKQDGKTYGTFAMRLAKGGFITTTRGKKGGDRHITRVVSVDHTSRVVNVEGEKATLNAPLLARLFETNPQFNYLVHGHDLIGNVSMHNPEDKYQFPGSVGDNCNAYTSTESMAVIKLPHHGYIAGFATFTECVRFLQQRGDHPANFWTHYQDIFPDRYVKEGHFDEFIRQTVKELKPRRILDLGGGASGTAALKDAGCEVFLLDPNIQQKPDWMQGKVELNTLMRFDLIVARGSINYLNESEINKLRNLLTTGGHLIANTFLVAPSQKGITRSYSTRNGESGEEWMRFDPLNRVVEHRLTPANGKLIEHQFYYYSPEQWQEMLPNVVIESYKKNSAVLKYKKQ